MNTQSISSLVYDFKYQIISGDCPSNSSYINLHNQAFLYWRDFWNAIYAPSHKVSADDFFRQKFIPIVTFKNEIVAMHLYTVFNPKSYVAMEHSYFTAYPKEFFEYLKLNNVKSVMSIESLTVNSDWRKSKIGLSLGETLIGCSLKFLDPLNIEAVIAPTRNDRGVNTMCYNFGFDCYKSALDFHGFEADLVVGFKNKVTPNPNNNINSLIDFLWKNRIDYTQKTITNQNSKEDFYQKEISA